MKTATFKMTVLMAFVMAGSLVARTEATVTVVNVDFNSETSPTYVGLAVAPDAPANTKWNGIPVPGGTLSVGQNNLLASDTTPSGVDVTLTAAQAWLNYYAGGTPALAPALIEDFAYINGDNTARLRLTNLSPLNRYTLYVYSQNTGVGNQHLDFFVDIGGSQNGTMNNAGNVSSFQPGVNYVEFDNLYPVNGQISGYWNGAGDGINGFQLVASTIPEPSMLMLVGVGAAALWFRRRVGRRAA